MQSFQLSSHAKRWLFKESDLARSNREDQASFTAGELRFVRANYVSVLLALGKQLRLRQTVTATAIVFFWRFCLTRSFSPFREAHEWPDCHPDWIAPTCLSLACKVEECPLPDVTVLASALDAVRRLAGLHYGVSVGPEFLDKVMASEFVLLEALGSDLLMFHPYQDVLAFVADMVDVSAVPMGNDCVVRLTKMAWDIVNDSLRTEACLLFAPFDVALAALFLATEKLQLHAASAAWWTDLKHDLEPVRRCMDFIVRRAYAPPMPKEDVERLCDRLYTLWSEAKARHH